MSTGPAPICVVCPLRHEQVTLRRMLDLDVPVACCGPGRRAGEWVRSEAPEAILILAGVAGALTSRCPIGSAWVPADVIDAEGAAVQRCPLADVNDDVRVVTVSRTIATPDDRAALARATSADLVDQESFPFACAASARGLPWLVVRGVSDGPSDRLPPGIDEWIDADGATRTAAVLRHLLRRPFDLPGVMRLGRRSTRALRSAAELIDRRRRGLSRVSSTGAATATSAETIVVYGGTFDPPQRAHVELPRLAARRLGATRVLYVPTSANPLKERRPTSAEDRLAMLRLALRDVPDAELSTLELDREGPSYTAETLAALRSQLPPDTTVRLLMGADNALSFPRWRDPDRILELATPAVLCRPPHDRGRLRDELAAHYPPDTLDRWMSWIVDAPMIDASATEVRRRLAAGEDVQELLDPAVEQYIRDHGLYGIEPGN